MSNTILEFENVGKLYRLGMIGTGTLSHDINRWWQTRVLHKEDPWQKLGEVNNRSRRGNSDYVWALRDISFKVQEGDVVGIIGRNGAGKSTLLKLLSRVTAPTTGLITYEGRIASLLEVGTGFHQELTGRENIYMNGAIMGMTRAEITRKFDEIVDFAGVERYIDTPVKRYSSGMRVRLGFAVAAFLDPDILVVDEVLAVGDAEFQRKAIGKMHDVASATGRTVLFVSHNMGAVRSLCQRGIVLEDGGIVFDGEVSDAINHYIAMNMDSSGNCIVDALDYKIDYLDISRISINGTELSESIVVPNQETLEVIVEGETREAFSGDIKLIFKNHSDIPVASCIEGRCTGKLYDFKPGRFVFGKVIRLPKYLAKGDYIIDLDLHEPGKQDFFRAPRCAQFHCDGSFDEFAHPILLDYEGFLSLESEKTELLQ